MTVDQACHIDPVIPPGYSPSTETWHAKLFICNGCGQVPTENDAITLFLVKSWDRPDYLILGRNCMEREKARAIQSAAGRHDG